MLFIWYVMFSSQACWLSTRAIISASFARMTACELSGLPKAFRWLTHLSKDKIRACSSEAKLERTSNTPRQYFAAP